MEMERSRFAGYRRIVARGRQITLTKKRRLSKQQIVAGSITPYDDTGTATVFVFGSFQLPRLRWVAFTRATPRV